MNDQLMTSEEVARKLRINIRTVTRLAKKKEISGAFKIGRQWRFPRSDIEKIMNNPKASQDVDITGD